MVPVIIKERDGRTSVVTSSMILKEVTTTTGEIAYTLENNPEVSTSRLDAVFVIGEHTITTNHFENTTEVVNLTTGNFVKLVGRLEFELMKFSEVEYIISSDKRVIYAPTLNDKFLFFAEDRDCNNRYYLETFYSYKWTLNNICGQYFAFALYKNQRIAFHFDFKLRQMFEWDYPAPNINFIDMKFINGEYYFVDKEKFGIYHKGKQVV